MARASKMIKESIVTNVAIKDGTALGGTVTGRYYPMKNFSRILAVIQTTLANGEDLELTLQQAKDVYGDSAKDLGDAVTFLNDSGGTREVVGRVEAYEDDMDGENDFTHVAVKALTSTSSDGSGFMIRGVKGFTGEDADDVHLEHTSTTSSTTSTTSTTTTE